MFERISVRMRREQSCSYIYKDVYEMQQDADCRIYMYTTEATAADDN